MTRPRIAKHGSTWRVYINGRTFYTGPTHAKAWQRAEAVANYAREHRAKHDIARISASLHRMENRKCSPC